MFFLRVVLSKELELDELLQRSSPWRSLGYHCKYLKTREEDTMYFVRVYYFDVFLFHFALPFSFCFVCLLSKLVTSLIN